MSIKREVCDEALRSLGVYIESWDRSWPHVMSLGRVYGENEVVQVFTQWAAVQAGLHYDSPLAEFVSIADNLLKRVAALKQLPGSNLLSLNKSSLQGQIVTRASRPLWRLTRQVDRPASG